MILWFELWHTICAGVYLTFGNSLRRFPGLQKLSIHFNTSIVGGEV